jgi:hypothetical protein
VIACTAIVCGSALTAWILWIRIQPRVTRKEFIALAEVVKLLGDKLNKAQQALLNRGQSF